MNVHIGKIVTKLLKEKGIKKVEFALCMNYSKQNINTLLLKNNWYVDQIWQASLVLQYNLFSFYSNDDNFKQFESTAIAYQSEIKKLEEKILFLTKENKLLVTLIDDKEKIIQLQARKK
jgi:hypothetical protein